MILYPLCLGTVLDGFENLSVRNVLMHPACYRFYDDMLYKSTF